MAPSLDVCRLCAQPKKIKSDIFSENNNVLQKITSLLSLAITVEDQLPKKICIDCQRILEQFHGFKLKCLRAEVKLNKIVIGNTPQKSNREIVKKELDEVDAISHWPTFEHNYFATVPSIINVKLERNDDAVERSLDIDDTVQVLLEEITSSNTLSDTKTTIEVVLDSDWQNPTPQEDASSKLEDEYINLELKPYLEINIQELNAEPTADFSGSHTVDCTEEDNIIDQASGKGLEFCDSDLMLKDGETCNIDDEAIEAEIMKKKYPDSRFECQKCSKSFKFLAGLRKHRKIHSESNEVFSCNLCSETNKAQYKFASLKSLKCHIYNKHLKKNEYFCQKCQIGFRTGMEYKCHVKSIHKRGSFKCNMCFKIFKSKSILKNHMEVHSESKKYVCNLCGSKFRWASSFKYHLDAHSNGKNFLCSECGTKFSSKASLQEHTNTHTGEHPYTCHMCHQSFSHLSTLKKHEALHRPLLYKCLTCEQSFSQQFLLKQHENIHTGSRPFVCKICSMTFRTQSNLCNHIKIHGEKRFQCNECDLKFTRGQQLRDHMGRHTGRKHICPAPNCGKEYSQRYPLTKHFRKEHTDFVLISKRGGHRKSNIKNEVPPTEGISYAYRYKKEIPVIYCIT